jgi:hypothetical protein
MQNDTIRIDSVTRPLPKWLINQKEGLTTLQPQNSVIREDNSLKISFLVTLLLIILILIISTTFVLKKYKKNNL